MKNANEDRLGRQTMEAKTCTGCGELKAIAEFSKNGGTRRKSRCKACLSGSKAIDVIAGHLSWYGSKNIRCVIKNNAPMYVLADVADALEMDRGHASRTLDEAQGIAPVATPFEALLPTPGGPQAHRLVDDTGLAHLTNASRSPRAREFRNWLVEQGVRILHGEPTRLPQGAEDPTGGQFQKALPGDPVLAQIAILQQLRLDQLSTQKQIKELDVSTASKFVALEEKVDAIAAKPPKHLEKSVEDQLIEFWRTRWHAVVQNVGKTGARIKELFHDCKTYRRHTNLDNCGIAEFRVMLQSLAADTKDQRFDDELKVLEEHTAKVLRRGQLKLV